jgi:hypothetical protein
MIETTDARVDFAPATKEYESASYLEAAYWAPAPATASLESGLPPIEHLAGMVLDETAPGRGGPNEHCVEGVG